MDTKQLGKQNALCGEAGTLRVASELMIRGVDVYFPAVDLGIDFITEHGVKVQVKSARLRTRPWGLKRKECYSFTRTHRIRGNATRPVLTYVRRDFTIVDYIVMWCVDSDEFYVVPSKIFASVGCLAIFPHRKLAFQGRSTKVEEVMTYRDRWDLLIPSMAVSAVESYEAKLIEKET